MRLVLAAALLAACHRGEVVPDGDVLDAIHQPTLHGKPGLVLFVTPTCSHCLATIPHAIDAAAAKAANITAVFVAGREENAKGVVDHAHFPGPWSVDDGSLTKRYGIHSVPYILVVGADGRARDALLGEQETSTLEDKLASAK
ncbi:MAG: hypothetical protein JO257_10500 [Deltaproteobacteria bacterium]|nr:hypothetical protein [Deltaproteobacteria bacterium]